MSPGLRQTKLSDTPEDIEAMLARALASNDSVVLLLLSLAVTGGS